MFKPIVALTLLLAYSIALRAQIQAPVDFEIKLSGTFGEIRSNHYHTGIDIKSPNGRTGHVIRAVDHGYIRRIKVDKSGYGYSLIIDHPASGLSSVYAHLDRFVAPIDTFVQRTQYGIESFEIDTILQDTLMEIKRGQIIGYLGDSGYSFGPHLHFEIRKTESQKPINPLIYFNNIRDNRAPVIRSIYVYTLDDHHKILKKQKLKAYKNGNSYRLEQDTIQVSGRRIAFGVEAVDISETARNKNGVYRLEMSSDSTLIYQLQFDSLDFEYSHLMNIQIDYEEKIKHKKNIYRCYFFNTGCPNINKVLIDKGILTLDEKESRNISIRLSDMQHNESKLDFVIRPSALAMSAKQDLHNIDVSFHRATWIDLDRLEILLPQHSFEKDIALFIDSVDHSSRDVISATYHIGDPSIPLLKKMELNFKIDEQEPFKDKLFVGRCLDEGYVSCGGEIEGAYLKAQVSRLGEYAVMIDSVPPSVEPVLWDTIWTNLHRIRFRIEDNIATTDGAQALRVRGTIDGKWMLWRYDYKNKSIDYFMDLELDPGRHNFRLEIIDDRGNKTIYKKTVYL